MPNRATNSVNGGSTGARGGIHSGPSGAGIVDNHSFFAAPVDAPDSEIAREVGVIVAKDKRGTPRSRDFKYNREACTAPLDPKLGVAKHFVSSMDGEVEEGNQTKSMYIQDVFVTNLAKIEELNTRMVQYDLKRIFLVSSLISGIDPRSVSHVADMWNTDQFDMMYCWDSIPWQTACYWQYSINKRCVEEDKISNHWALLLLYNSCTADLKDQINLKYKPLPDLFQGAVTYCWVIFFCLFATSRDTTSALLKYLQIWRSNGLRRIPGENVATAYKRLMAVARRLHATNNLVDEAIQDVIYGLEKGSVTAFTEIFSDMRKDYTKSSLIAGPTASMGRDRVLMEISRILRLAMDLYNNLSTTSQWNIPKGHPKFNNLTGGNTCWNCGADHMITDCPKPRNEDVIKKNREEFFKSRNGGNSGRGGRGGGRGGRGGPGRGGGGGRGDGNYSREKWGAPGKGDKQIRWVSNVAHVYCGKSHQGTPCGWNSTHSTKFHEPATTTQNWSLKSLALLSPNHPLVLASKSKTGPPATNNDQPPPAPTDSSGTEGSAINTLKHAKTVLSQLERSAKSDEARGIIESTMEALGLGN